MEFITDITMSIDEADYRNARMFLQSYKVERKGSCFKVRGTFEELENLSVQLSALQRHHCPTTPCEQDDHTSNQRSALTSHLKPLHVNAAVLDYIEQKRSKELDRIIGKSFYKETQPDVRTVNNLPSRTVQVTFRPNSASMLPVHADFVRQRFITFYQKIASDLQVISLPANSHDQQDLQSKFPQLFLKPSHKGEITVTGPFVLIARFKEFLLQNVPNSFKSTLQERPPKTQGRRTSSPSPLHSKDTEDESCPICMETIEITEKETLECKHSFCRTCLKKAFKYKPVCATCGKVYGALTGTQPEGGTIRFSKMSIPLPGYDQYGTIIIQYDIPSGIQKEEHPHPGEPYQGVSRTAYLPNSSEGRRILSLLRKAFDQRLIFTVGQSTTSGRNNTVTWNDIHHKTSTHGGTTHYGYPDPDYLSRVADELKAKGIK